MKTTALFIEYLVVGSQAAVWLGLVLVLAVDATTIAEATTAVGSWSFLLSVVSIGILYTVGIIIERVAGAVLPIKTGFFLIGKVPWIVGKENLARDERRKLSRAQGKLSEDLEYELSRIRIIRASILNVLIAYCLVVALVLKYASSVVELIVFFSIVLVAVLAVLFLTLVILLIAYKVSLEYVGSN